MTYSYINEATGRKAMLIDGGVRLLKVSGSKRKSERQVWPDIIGQDTVKIAEQWIEKGRIEI